MQISPDQFSIEWQQQAVNAGDHVTTLVAPCAIGKGILQLNSEMQQYFKDFFLQSKLRPTFFIPASGSGSRMFECVYSAIENDSSSALEEVKRWMLELPKMAFFKQFPDTIQQGVLQQTLSPIDFAHWLLHDDVVRIQSLPKGLIPFHCYPDGLRNAFQEQVVQAQVGFNEQVDFHFTIHSQFEHEIRTAITSVLNNTSSHVSFSEQDPKTNSVVFDEHSALVYDENDHVLTRPSGHGALLSNLNRLGSEVICVKNIDNVQHSDRMGETNHQWHVLIGVLLACRTRAKALVQQFNRTDWESFLRDYQLSWQDDELLTLAEDAIISLLNRPLRVCGMVKNVGQPGGGPFWIEMQGSIRKQIVEKAQISKHSDQMALLQESSHFNPVMMVLSPLDLNGNKLDLEQFVDYQQYFVVSKMHHGQPIRYVERPGLWNGSMANWTTIFVEIPSEVFSPVKEITDLLNDAHQPL